MRLAGYIACVVVLAVILAAVLAKGAPTLAGAEQYCTIGDEGSVKDETIACYSDAGCAYAASLGGEPVRDYEVSSAPYALARGKIAAIVTSAPKLVAKVKELKGKCRPL